MYVPCMAFVDHYLIKRRLKVVFWLHFSQRRVKQAQTLQRAGLFKISGIIGVLPLQGRVREVGLCQLRPVLYSRIYLNVSIHVHMYVFDFHRNLAPVHILSSTPYTQYAHDATGAMQLLCTMAQCVYCWRSMYAERRNLGVVSVLITIMNLMCWLILTSMNGSDQQCQM